MAHVSAAERRPQLIQAAIELMAREGIAAGSTRAIAAELGVAQATVHYTFGTKKDLYRAVVETLASDFVERVAAAVPEGGTFETQLGTLAEALWTSVTTQAGHWLLLAEFAGLAMRDDELRDIMRGHQRGIEDAGTVILTAVAEGTGEKLALPARDIAVFFLAGVEGLAQRYLVLQENDPAGAADNPGGDAAASTPASAPAATGAATGAQAVDAEARRALDLLISSTLNLCRGPRS